MNIARLGDNQRPSPNSQPSFFKKIGVSTYLCFLFSLIGGLLLSSELILIPSRVFDSFEFWRCLTFAFGSPSLFGMIFQLLFVYFWAYQYEKEKKSLNLPIRILTLSLFTSLFDLTFYKILLYVWPAQANRLIAFGFFRLYFVELCVRCFKDPWTQTSLFCIPGSFAQIFIIPIFLLIDLILNKMYLGNLPCILAGYVLYAFLDNFSRFELTAESVKNLERKLLCLDLFGTFYTLNDKTSLLAVTLEEIPKTYTMPKSSVGGKNVNEEQRREEWVKKFGSDDPQISKETSEDLEAGKEAKTEESIGEGEVSEIHLNI